MKKWCTLLFVIVALFACSVTAVAAPLASDMENYVGNPGMYVTQASDGIHVELDPEEGATFTTAWGYNCEQVMDGLTITLKDAKLNAAKESGLCIALGNYEGAYYGDRCLMFVLNASPDDGAWVFCGQGNGDGEVIPMTGTGLYGFTDGMDITFKWEKKNDTTWVWKVNEKAYEFSAKDVQSVIDDEEFMFVSFGGWNAVADVEYTITGVGLEEDLMNQEPVEPETSEEPADETDNGDEDGLPTGILVVIIVLAVLLLAAIGLIVYLFVIKPKKSA